MIFENKGGKSSFAKILNPSFFQKLSRNNRFLLKFWKHHNFFQNLKTTKTTFVPTLLTNDFDKFGNDVDKNLS